VSKSIEQLVNQQVLRWLQEQRNTVGAVALHTREAQRPMVTISREYGALGATIGRRVAEQLGFEYYEQELVHEIAKHAHVRKKIVESLDERSQTRIGSWVNDMMTGGLFAPSDYLRNLSQVIVTLGRHGRSVIIGRGAHLILDRKHTLRVRTYSPLEDRVRYIARRDGLSLAAARRKVQRIDGERATFYQQHFKNDVENPLSFDMLLNTSTLGLEECSSAIVAAYRRRFEGPVN
jgi:cytidylate kinase